ncbi:MAG TPA: hypothetical protein VEK80_03415 [Kribbellaceae bacterium]|nr:hypothetical protein [Kribbellaceae bacterium]
MIPVSRNPTGRQRASAAVIAAAQRGTTSSAAEAFSRYVSSARTVKCANPRAPVQK